MHLFLRESLRTRLSSSCLLNLRSWPDNLDKFFEKAGLQDIIFEGTWTERSDLSYHMDVSLLVYEELIDMIVVQQRATPEEIEELRTRLAKAAAEARQGAAHNTKKLVAVGRKPI